MALGLELWLKRYECLSGKREALSSNPSSAKKKKNNNNPKVNKFPLCWWSGSSGKVPA
jgi:hypothetical protein